ncbi:MAG: hypothetical protein NTU73_08920, partial [Ignavibacteriae bacterium]|nr:hypothetical protein [Ignavibacteriota bacterium]
MKKRILLSVLLVAITTTVLYFKLNANNNTFTATQVSPADTAFLLGVFSDGGDTKYDRLRDSLHLNGWHTYGSWSELIGTVEDNVETDPSVYFNAVQNKLRQNSDAGLMTIMNRPKFWYLANSQRSDYQCETINQGSDYWFYAYNIHNTGETEFDSGVYV